MYKKLFSLTKKIIPRISDTELIALRSGTTSIDKEIFLGKVNYPKKEITRTKISNEEINDLLYRYGSNQHIYPYGAYKNLFKYIGEKGFLSFIIEEKYGGKHLSVDELSNVLCKIASYNPALGVSIMVPNSLGPGELLQHYGTEKQKDFYLPKLADGTYVPCFGLTGPNNGSDATGSIDSGNVIIKDGKKYIEVSINKRYITLGPIANLIGLAFNVNDKAGILDNGNSGVTVALIESEHPGLIQDTHHNPLNAGFPNGTLKGDLLIPVENIIGGENNIGKGWKMLMECLAAGRGICLPATAKASSNTAMVGVFEYARNRKQFKMPLIKMEGVQQKLANMLYNTWLIHCSVKLTNNLLDSGEKPAVISAIMKQQTTDRAREVLNDAMDVHAGGAICIGENNFLEKFYRSAPIGITVEGSNTLTRNLIIFGQGLNKSHPFIFPILDSILNNNVDNFKMNFNKIIHHSLSLYFKSMVNYECSTTLEKQTLHFASLANFIALNGGSLKSKQMLSSDMADILSNLYLAHSVQWYHTNFGVSQKLTTYCIERLCQENQRIINRVVDNNGYLKGLLFFMKKREVSYNYADTNNIIDELVNNNTLLGDLKRDIIVKDNALEKLIKLSELKALTNDNNEAYNYLYDEVISVGEYENPQK